MFQIKTGEQISHFDLREEYIPRQGVAWSKIIPFASTFNVYEQLGEFKSAVIVGNGNVRDFSVCSLTDLRSALFSEYRRYNHFGYDPDAQAMEYLHSLLEEIRRRIQNGEHLRAHET